MMVYVFPGQGSQAVGMGEGLFERYPDYVAQADEMLGYSIEKLCLEDPDQLLSDTRYTQPALFVVNALSYLNILDRRVARPCCVAGHSLGEYSALFAAGALSFASGLAIVKQRGELMARASEGGMAAVLGLTGEAVLDILVSGNLTQVDIANFNSLTQIVISGQRADIDRAQALFEKAGCYAYVPLQVSGAFHSRMMEGAQQIFAERIADIEVGVPQIPVISNVEARPYAPHRVRELLVAQMARPVRWSDSIRYLLGHYQAEFEEVGPGNVLTKLIKSIRRDLSTQQDESSVAA